MWPKRFILMPALALLFFLGIYSWNKKTGTLDDLSTGSGLEVVGIVLRSTNYVRTSISAIWSRYLDLVNVRTENDRLCASLEEIQNQLTLAAEERAELRRLRALLQIETPDDWPTTAARVIGGRMGSNAAMDTIIIARGFMTGATPDSPAVTVGGVVGRVLRAGPTTGTVLLVTDPVSKIAVIGQDSRVQGVLVGGGAGKHLEIFYTPHNNTLQVNEVLVTSGLDNVFPKGLPVAVISSVAPANIAPFPDIQARPLADFSRLEEVLLLERPMGKNRDLPITDTFVGPHPAWPLMNDFH